MLMLGFVPKISQAAKFAHSQTQITFSPIGAMGSQAEWRRLFILSKALSRSNEYIKQAPLSGMSWARRHFEWIVISDNPFF